jgi:ribosomal protein L16 Arg81 hydroxylase
MTIYNVNKESLNNMLLSSIKNSEVIHVKNFINTFLSWEDFIKIVDYQYNNSESVDTPDRVKNNMSRKPTKISKYTEFHYHLLELTSTDVPVINLESEFPKIYDFMEYIRDSVKSRATLKALVNIVGNEFSGNKHHDPYHVFSVQHIGTVEYNIFDSEDNKITYTLEPGDLIFMPSGTTHSISASTSRGTLILDIE